MKKVIVLLVVPAIACIFLIGKGEPAFLERICKGDARCLYGTVEQIVDGDTLRIGDETVRLALINTPEKTEYDYTDSVEFVKSICPVGSEVIVDEDDMQISRSHRRIIAVVYCRSERMVNLNEELLDSRYAEILGDFCERSEFADEDWAILYGCG
jgi:endonuclease YncB( thermonuclease family)